MIDIIAKLGAATESTFELNAAIARLDWYREQFGDCADNEVPDFCGSIDAAMKLVPEFLNRRWYLADSDANSDGKAVASVYHPADMAETGRIPRSVGATPALALCIAALKAKSRSPQP